jgi:hypothetical protein
VSIPVAAEKKLLTPEDFEAVKVTHHPAISDLSLESLKSARHDLGERREKLRVILVESRRARVRRTASEASSKGDEAQVGWRKQVFSKALRRLNHELHRREEVEARARPASTGPRPETQPRKAAAKANASAPKEASPAKPARGRTAKAKPSEAPREASSEAKGRKASKKEG